MLISSLWEALVSTLLVCCQTRPRVRKKSYSMTGLLPARRVSPPCASPKTHRRFSTSTRTLMRAQFPMTAELAVLSKLSRKMSSWAMMSRMWSKMWVTCLTAFMSCKPSMTWGKRLKASQNYSLAQMYLSMFVCFSKSTDSDRKQESLYSTSLRLFCLETISMAKSTTNSEFKSTNFYKK